MKPFFIVNAVLSGVLEQLDQAALKPAEGGGDE